jgi:putative glycosyltransferase (TIGR04372 family)
MPLRVVGLLLRKFSKFNLVDSYHFPQIGRQSIYGPKIPSKKFSLESVLKFNWDKKTYEKINFIIKLNGNVHDGYEHQKIGIPENSWFVCVHVREHGFWGDKGRRDHRNSNISNYIPAIKEITSRGGWVVRMGDNTMKPLPRMENVIDYPFTRYKSEFMDLCLIQNCRFFIGTQTGLLGFATLASKKILLTNMYDQPKICGRAILKHLYSKQDKRYLSIKESLLMDLRDSPFPVYGFSDENYIYVENNEGEILNAVLEYMDFLSSDDLSLTSKQKEYNEYLKKYVYRLAIDTRTRITSPRTHNDEGEIGARYQFAAQWEMLKGTLCAGFLEEHW